MVTGAKACWPKSYTRISLTAIFVLFSAVMLLYSRLFMPIPIFLYGFAIIIFFFVGLDNYSARWQSLSEKEFTKRLFWHSFLYRFIFVVLLYVLTLWLDPKSFPFEIYAADSWTYHIQAIEISKNIFNGHLFQTLPALITTQDDFGFPTYLGFIYSLMEHGGNAFAASIPVRLLNCLWGSLTVIYISKMARMIYSDEQARLAGVIAMLMPPLLWFGGLQLKETLMIFLIVLVFYHAMKIVHLRKINIISLLFILLSFLLFFFRVFLGTLVIGCVALYFFINLTRRKTNVPLLVFVGILFVLGELYLIKHAGFNNQVSHNISQANITMLQNQLTSNAHRTGVSFNAIALTPLVLLTGVLCPFPALLNLDPNQLAIFTTFQNEIVRNVMYFFAFAGIFFSLRTNFRNSVLIFAFSLGNIFAATLAGYSVYDRFQLPALPFLIIFMAEGVKHSTTKTTRVWVAYLLIVMAMIFAWNIFKLKIRGL